MENKTDLKKLFIDLAEKKDFLKKCFKRVV